MEQQQREEQQGFNTDELVEKALLEALEGIARSDAKTRERVRQKEIEFFN